MEKQDGEILTINTEIKQDGEILERIKGMTLDEIENDDLEHIHIWVAADELVFVAGEHKGSAIDVFCVDCNVGALVDSDGEIIESSIAECGFIDEIEED